jgi:hypothetical protein
MAKDEKGEFDKVGERDNVNRQTPRQHSVHKLYKKQQQPENRRNLLNLTRF